MFGCGLGFRLQVRGWASGSVGRKGLRWRRESSGGTTHMPPPAPRASPFAACVCVRACVMMMMMMHTHTQQQLHSRHELMRLNRMWVLFFGFH